MNAVVIGLGRMGENHLRALINLDIEIIAVCDSRNPLELTETTRELITGIDYFISVDEMVSAGIKFDLAVVATTTPGREAIVDLLLRTQVSHILCEKPLSNSIQSARSIVAKCKKSDIKLAVNHQMRFMKQYEIINELSESHNLGPLRSMVVSAANIGLGMNVTHFIEAFNWLTQSPLIEFSSKLETNPIGNPRGVQFEDRAGHLIGYNKHNQRLFVEFGSDIGHKIYVTYNFKTSKIIIDELNGRVLLDKRSDELLNFPTSRYGCGNIVHEFEILPTSSSEPTEKVISALCDGEDYPDGESGFLTVAGAFAAIKSSELKGQITSIFEENSREVDWA